MARKKAQPRKSIPPPIPGAGEYSSLQNFFARVMIPAMKKLVLCLMPYALCLALFATRAHATDFVPGFEDIPLQVGVFAIVDDGIVYSVPDGKIIQTTVASDDVSRREFQRFYRDAMKQLGWKMTRDERKSQEFTRGEDVLTIEIIETDPLSARFELKPN